MLIFISNQELMGFPRLSHRENMFDLFDTNYRRLNDQEYASNSLFLIQIDYNKRDRNVIL